MSIIQTFLSFLSTVFVDVAGACQIIIQHEIIKKKSRMTALGKGKATLIGLGCILFLSYGGIVEWTGLKDKSHYLWDFLFFIYILLFIYYYFENWGYIMLNVGMDTSRSK